MNRDAVFVHLETTRKAEGLPSEKVLAVLVDGPGVWVGTEEELAVLKHRSTSILGTSDGLPYRVITALAVDPQSGDLWIATMGGLAPLSPARIDMFTQLNSGLESCPRATRSPASISMKKLLVGDGCRSRPWNRQRRHAHATTWVRRPGKGEEK